MTAHRIKSEHAAWLGKRGILEAALATGVFSGSGYGGKGEALRIPYGDGWFKIYMPGAKDPWLQEKPKGVNLPLWRNEQINFDAPWVLTEGEWDALSAWQVGYRNATSIPDGAIQPEESKPHSSGKLAAVSNDWDRIGPAKGDVILALDNDAPGVVTTNTLADILGRWRCRRVEYPKHQKGTGLGGRCKDLNEVLLLCGAETLRKTLDEAKPLELEGVYRITEIPRGNDRCYYSIGFDGLERNISLFRGELCTLTGITGHGKTTFLLNVLGQLVQLHGLKIGLGTFEADPWEDIIPFYETWLFGRDKPPTARQDTIAWFDENFVLISHQVKPLSKQADIRWFLDTMTEAKGRHGIDVSVLDPWNKLQHRRPGGENQTDYINGALAEMRNFSVTTNTISIVSSHPTVEAQRANKMPEETDIAGSANWGNQSDHVAAIHRPDKKLNKSCIQVHKSRFRAAGIEGKCWYTFNPDTNRYTRLPLHLWPQEDL